MREYLKHFILFENLSSIHESKKNSVRKTHTHTPRTQTQTQHETQGYIQSLSQTQSYKIRLRRSYYLPHPVVSHLTSIGRPSYPVCWCACPRECSVTAFVSLRSGERDKTLNRVNPSKLPHWIAALLVNWVSTWTWVSFWTWDSRVRVIVTETHLSAGRFWTNLICLGLCPDPNRGLNLSLSVVIVTETHPSAGRFWTNLIRPGSVSGPKPYWCRLKPRLRLIGVSFRVNLNLSLIWVWVWV